MSPFESEVLRKAARLSYGVVLRDATGRVAGTASDSIPVLFLWIEFWELTMATFAGQDSAPSTAFQRSLETLEADGYWQSRNGCFVPEGTYTYSSLVGSKWEIEAQWPSEGPQFVEVSGEARVVYPQRRVLAAPLGMMDSLRGEVSPNTAHVAYVNQITPYGMCIDAWKHASIRLTAKGRTEAALTVADFVPPRESEKPATVQHGAGAGDKGIPDTALMSARDLAKAWGLDSHLDAVKKALSRAKLSDGAKVENMDRTSKEPQFTYRVGCVRAILDKLRDSLS